MVGGADFHVAEGGELAAVFAGEAYYVHAGRFGGFGGAQHVGRVAAGADGEEDDAGLEDAAFIEEQEEAGSADVSDIIGDGVEKEEET